MNCQCTNQEPPFFCPRYQREMGPELHAICQGTFLAEQRDQYVANWEKVRDGQIKPKPAAKQPARLTLPCPHRLAPTRTVNCPQCQGGPKTVYGCELQGECVPIGNDKTRRAKITDCSRCDHLPENVEATPVPELSVTMAVFDDYAGAWMTIMDLLMNHEDGTDDLSGVEIVVGDNNPDSSEGEQLRKVCLNTEGVRYFAIRDVTGSSLPKDRVIRQARGNAVLQLDSHVILPAGTIARLKQHYRDHPETTDLITGPILHRPGQVNDTHQTLQWRGGNLGVWANHPPAKQATGEPFEVPQNGTGLFSFRREAWLGYHPSFHGYGGNESYLYEKWRRHGRKTICLPWLRWLHRFGHPGGTKYANRWAEKCRNYLITLDALGWDRQPMLDHYKKAWGSPKKLAACVAAYEAEFPLATCVLRPKEDTTREAVQEAIQSFLLQEWPRKELQIVSGEEIELPDPRMKVVSEPSGQWQIPWQPGTHHALELQTKMKAALGHAFRERLPTYQDTIKEWKKAGGDTSGAVPRKLWLLIASCLEPGMKTLEFGSGVSTWLFDRAGCDHLAIESSRRWANRVNQGRRRGADVLIRRLETSGNHPPFYDWQPAADGKPYDVILVDGPKGEGNREGVLSVIDRVSDDRTVIFVDDLHRPGEAQLAQGLRVRTGKKLTVHADGQRKFGVLV